MARPVRPPPKAFSTADATSPTRLKRSWGGEEQNVALALVVAFFVIMLLELKRSVLGGLHDEYHMVKEAA